MNTIHKTTMFSCLNAVWFVPPYSAFGRDWRAAVFITGVSNSTIPHEVGALICLLWQGPGAVVWQSCESGTFDIR